MTRFPESTVISVRGLIVRMEVNGSGLSGLISAARAEVEFAINQVNQDGRQEEALLSNCGNRETV